MSMRGVASWHVGLLGMHSGPSEHDRRIEISVQTPHGLSVLSVFWQQQSKSCSLPSVLMAQASAVTRLSHRTTHNTLYDSLCGDFVCGGAR